MESDSKILLFLKKSFCVICILSRSWAFIYRNIEKTRGYFCYVMTKVGFLNSHLLPAAICWCSTCQQTTEASRFWCKHLIVEMKEESTLQTLRAAWLDTFAFRSDGSQMGQDWTGTWEITYCCAGLDQL